MGLALREVKWEWRKRREEEGASREQRVARSPGAIQGGGMGNVLLHGQGLPWQGF